jgi:hypothetical protein
MGLAMPLSRWYVSILVCLLAFLTIRGVNRADDLPRSSPALSVPSLELRVQRTLKTDGPPRSISLSADGRFLATEEWPAPDGLWGRVWNTRTGEVVARFGVKDVSLGKTCLSPDGRTVAFSQDGSFDIHLFNVGKSEIARDLSGHRDHVHRIVYSPDGKLIASVGLNRDLFLWDAATGKQLHRAFSDDYPFQYGCEIAFSPDSKTLALATGDHSIHLLDVATAKEKRLFDVPPMLAPTPTALAFSPDGRQLVLGLRSENCIPVWDVRNGKLMRQHTWEKDHERPELARYKGHIPLGEGTMSLSFTGDGRLLIAATRGMRLRAWETASGGLRFQIDEHMPFLAAAPGGSIFCGNVRGKHVSIWDTRTPVQLPRSVTSLNAERVWSGLADIDAASSYKLMRDLMAAPQEAVTLLGKRLSTVAPVRTAVIERLVADLDDDTFEVREKSSRRLSELGEAARPALSSALTRQPSAEARRRIKELLDALDAPADGERLRLLRAVEVLESIGTPEARRVLERLAEGETHALLTREAKAALRRANPN